MVAVAVECLEGVIVFDGITRRLLDGDILVALCDRDMFPALTLSVVSGCFGLVCLPDCGLRSVEVMGAFF